MCRLMSIFAGDAGSWGLVFPYAWTLKSPIFPIHVKLTYDPGPLEEVVLQTEGAHPVTGDITPLESIMRLFPALSDSFNPGALAPKAERAHPASDTRLRS